MGHGWTCLLFPIPACRSCGYYPPDPSKCPPNKGAAGGETFNIPSSSGAEYTFEGEIFVDETLCKPLNGNFEHSLCTLPEQIHSGIPGTNVDVPITDEICDMIKGTWAGGRCTLPPQLSLQDLPDEIPGVDLPGPGDGTKIKRHDGDMGARPGTGDRTHHVMVYLMNSGIMVRAFVAATIWLFMFGILGFFIYEGVQVKRKWEHDRSRLHRVVEIVEEKDRGSNANNHVFVDTEYKDRV